MKVYEQYKTVVDYGHAIAKSTSDNQLLPVAVLGRPSQSELTIEVSHIVRLNPGETIIHLFREDAISEKALENCHQDETIGIFPFHIHGASNHDFLHLVELTTVQEYLDLLHQWQAWRVDGGLMPPHETLVESAARRQSRSWKYYNWNGQSVHITENEWYGLRKNAETVVINEDAGKTFIQNHYDAKWLRYDADNYSVEVCDDPLELDQNDAAPLPRQMDTETIEIDAD